MPGIRLIFRPIQLWLACAVLAVALAAPARAQVVVVANGSPITEIDIQQRTKLINAANHKNPSRQEVINELIDDRIKIAKAKTYGVEVTDTEVDNGFENMARRQRHSEHGAGQPELDRFKVQTHSRHRDVHHLKLKRAAARQGAAPMITGSTAGSAPG